MIAYFPGKFNPPHIGHITTIHKIAKRYDEVIVGVLCEPLKDGLVSQEEIVKIMREVVPENVSFHILDTNISKRESPKGLPEFDIMLSGNPVVLEWADKHGVKSEFIERSEGFLCKASDIRKYYGKKSS